MGTKSQTAFRRAVPVLIGLVLFGLAATIARGARLERADMVMNNGTEITTLDPGTVSGVPEGRVMYALYEGLTAKDPKTLEPIEGMAERWEVSEDGLEYTFYIREDARWSNGDPLTAHDFEWSWRRLLEPETAAYYVYQLWYVREAKKYSLVPPDRLYSQNLVHGTWVQPLGDNRARLGFHGMCSLPKDLVPETRFQIPLNSGDEFTWDTAFIERLGDGTHWHAYAEGTVLRVNGDLPETFGELFENPYDNWVLEFEYEPGTLERLREEDILYPVGIARDELFWPRVGIQATDDHTLVVRLDAPVPYFLHLTSFYPTFPVHRGTFEWAKREFPETWQVEWVRPGNIVTNGPFQIVERRVNDRIRVEKNPLYWDADNVALRTIDILAVENYGTMLNMYLTGSIDWIDKCAPNLIPRMLPREDFNPESYLGTYFYRVNVHEPPFGDVRVRRALALTIDRRAITEKITKKGEIPLWSLCPGGMPGYQPSEMEHTPIAPDGSNYDSAFAADCERARELFAKAGYGENGKPFPTIEIHYNTAEVHRDLAEVISDGWKRTLGVDAKLLNQEWKVYLETQSRTDFDVSRSAWIGDYPDPNTFIDVFVTGGENNRTGWGNPRYDGFVAAAGKERDPKRRMELLAEAEAILMEELPVLPIFSYASQNIVNPRLGGFFENVQDDHYPKFWYWMDDEELAQRRADQPEEWGLVDAPGPSQGLYSPAEEARRTSNRR